MPVLETVPEGRLVIVVTPVTVAELLMRPPVVIVLLVEGLDAVVEPFMRAVASFLAAGVVLTAELLLVATRLDLVAEFDAATVALSALLTVLLVPMPLRLDVPLLNTLSEPVSYLCP